MNSSLLIHLRISPLCHSLILNATHCELEVIEPPIPIGAFHTLITPAGYAAIRENIAL